MMHVGTFLSRDCDRRHILTVGDVEIILVKEFCSERLVVYINYRGSAELFRRGQLVDPHGLKPPHTFAVLVEYLMKEKGAVDRRAYAIVSDGQPYNAAAIKKIYHRPDFPRAR